MKKVFVYFDNIAMCETPAQAKAFIDSIDGLTCNTHTERLLEDLFAGRKDYHGEEIHSLATTGCGKSRIRIYDALGPTLQAHQEEYMRREAARHKQAEDLRSRQMMARSESDRAKIARLMEHDEGTYRVTMTIWSYDRDAHTGNFPQSATEGTFTCTVTASCGTEAYAKAVRQAILSHDIVDYVNMTDSRFACTKL